ncbi:MAG: UDP-N-acetylglucosamine acyltransferase [Chlamydiales bacterium]|jgi:UDP-N-acetylglucosamine acyltransferase
MSATEDQKKDSNIHPSAIIDPGAKIGRNVTIEAYAVINGSVTIEDDVVIKSFVYVDGNTTIGQGTVIWPSASIGTKTQDLKYRGETTYVIIGKNCEIREFVTINASCGESSEVRVGDNCLIMAYCHIAHNCELGNHVIMSNNATLAGHVQVEDYAIIGGMTPVHQFSRIGRYAMVGGMSRVTHDVLPYTVGGSIPYKFGGVNTVGLKRHGFSFEARKALAKAFKLLYRSGLRLDEALDKTEREVEDLPEVRHWLRFARESRRGLIGLQGIAQTPEEGAQVDEVEELKNLSAATT